LIYRPEFAYSTPPGFRDQEFEHFYDTTSTPGFNPATGTQSVLNIPLNIDTDAEFRWRGIRLKFTDSDEDLSGIANIGLRWRTPEGAYLSPSSDTSPFGFVPVYLAYITPKNDNNVNGGMSCIIEPEIICPAASVVWLDMFSFDLGVSGYLQFLWLTGVKRFSDEKSCGCAEVCDVR
jgi:hypothetical protein